MNHRLTLTAAGAVILASISLYPLIQGIGWFWAGCGAVIVAAAAGTATRLPAVPAGMIAMVLALGVAALCRRLTPAGGTGNCSGWSSSWPRPPA